MNILFVCTGNTCRSAIAEAAARRIIADAPEQYGAFQVASAGVMCAGPSPPLRRRSRTAVTYPGLPPGKLPPN